MGEQVLANIVAIGPIVQDDAADAIMDDGIALDRVPVCPSSGPISGQPDPGPGVQGKRVSGDDVVVRLDVDSSIGIQV